MSADLASESAHITAESSDHDLNAFQAIRRMDEILLANFMVFHDVVEDGDYDLVVGDEAWDVDYYFHENPELKRTAFAWMTDFVGWLPMPGGGEREAFVTADYNAEMIEQVERFPRVRDRAIFVGEPDDIVADDFGPGLPSIRDWTERHFEFSGYVTGFDPTRPRRGPRRPASELGYGPDERVVIVTVGGSGVGEALLRRVIASYPDAARRVNGLRMVVVAGPRIDPATLDPPRGVEVRAFVPSLYRHLAVCDLAVVQGGLTTTMESRRPVDPSCTSRCATISSRTATSATGWTATAPVGAWTTRRPRRNSSPRRSPRRSIGRSTTGRSRRTARPARPR